jgi:acid phosphatase (class A)
MIRTMKKYKLSGRHFLIILSVIVLVLAFNGCAPSKYADIAENLKEAYPGQPEGYLKTDELPNSATLLPPPPKPGSAAFDFDMEVSEKYLHSNDSVRWQKAKIDANLDFPIAIDSFTAILDKKISVESTPYLYLLLQRTIADASASTSSAKIYYKRLRPFVVNNQPTCDPESETYLRTSGSYPSGHSAIGWTWALILTELFPDQTNEILQKGREFGESRYVCNMHWYSDVDEGRFMGSATVATLQGNKLFQHDLKKARREVKRISN